MSDAYIAPTSLSAREIRLARTRRLVLRLLFWVVIPTALAILYYGCYTTPQYVSVATFSVRSNDMMAASAGELADLLPKDNLSADVRLLEGLIRSQTMLDRLVAEHGLLEHYRNPNADWLSRLDSDTTGGELLDYYRERVHVGGKATSMTLRVRAFDAKKAQEFAAAIVGYAEQMLNQATEKARQQRVHIAEQGVVGAEKRLAAARQRVLELQVAGAEINPAKSAQALLEVRSKLEGELADAQADLDSLQAVMGKGASRVVAARARVDSLQRQIAKQTERMVDGDGKSLNQAIAEFEPALIEKEFAENAYKAALKTLELARIETIREQRYLVSISPASLPSRPSYPKRMWGVLRVAVLGLVLMGVVTLLIAAVREHARL